MLHVNGEQFVPVGVLETNCNAPDEVVRSNIRTNIIRPLPRLHQLSDYGKYKGKPLAIVAGGPSLDDVLDELRAFDCIMVCGSAHDPIVERGFIPHYCVVNDADICVMDFLKLPDCRTTYFLASMCDPRVFHELADFPVVLWHSYQCDNEIFGDELQHAICGGCTVTLRAMNIAIMLGFQDLHFFGLDSSFTDREYAYSGNPENKIVIPARVGNREFRTTPGLLAQATHFQAMCERFGYMFTPTVHGDGMIAEMLKQREVA